MIVSDFSKKKVVEYLDKQRAAAFIFNHGLGDFCLFLPLFYELKKRYRNHNLQIFCAEPRKLYLVNTYCHSVLDQDIRALFQRYRVVFRLSYPEPPIGGEISKPYYCNEKEIGLDNFEWKPYKMFPDFKVNEKSNMVGFHLCGNSNSKIKNIDIDLGRQMMKECTQLGYLPYLCQDFDLKQMIEMMARTRYFVGIESGPIYMAGTIIGYDNCIGLERNMLFKRYLPINIAKIDVDHYQAGMLSEKLRGLGK